MYIFAPMELHQWLFGLIILFILIEFIFDKYVDALNAASWKESIPDIVSGIYDNEKYETARQYAQENGRLSLVSSSLSFVVILIVLIFDGFAWLDEYVRSITTHPILMTLLFFGIIGVVSSVIGFPFRIYSTFVIEEKYGFNKTNVKTFVVDLIKSTVLSIIIGGGILALITYLYGTFLDSFWILAWMVVSGFSFFFATFYTTLILPLFNQLTPLEDGPLREAIEAYTKQVDFPLKNIYIIDGSKRNTKANAFFSGMGKVKSIVLYDTLIKEHSIEEITAILAHEVGHYKKKHIQKSMVISLLQTGLLLFIFGKLAQSSLLAQILGASENSFHLSLIAFGLLYAPISLLTGIAMNAYSRKNEYEADEYAKKTFRAGPLISSLKKLSVNHLSNLTPNKLYVFIHYSHPPLAKRLKSLQE